MFLLRAILDLYVYNTCDYFTYLDMCNGSYAVFSGSNSGTPLSPAVSNDCDTAIMDYACLLYTSIWNISSCAWMTICEWKPCARPTM